MLADVKWGLANGESEASMSGTGLNNGTGINTGVKSLTIQIGDRVGLIYVPEITGETIPYVEYVTVVWLGTFENRETARCENSTGDLIEFPVEIVFQINGGGWAFIA